MLKTLQNYNLFIHKKSEEIKCENLGQFSGFEGILFQNEMILLFLIDVMGKLVPGPGQNNICASM